VGRYRLSVCLRDRKIPAKNGRGSSPPDRPPNVRGAGLRRLFVRAARDGLPPRRHPVSLSAFERGLRRGAALLARQLHEPQGRRTWSDVAASPRRRARPAPGRLRAEHRLRPDGRDGRDARHLEGPAAHRPGHRRGKRRVPRQLAHRPVTYRITYAVTYLRS
jgi:hypothetical protein